MVTRRLLNCFLACSLLMASACSLFTPTTPSAGQDGGLTMLVMPDDAEVFVDGASMGPAGQYRGHTFLQLKGGKHLVEIKKPGYRDYREEIFVGGNLVSITVRLKKAD